MVSERGNPGDPKIVLPYALTPAQQRSRRLRNIAIALVIAGLCILFYVMTIAKLGAGFLTRPI
jgi:hypothetical protein